MDPLSIGASALTVAGALVGALRAVQTVRKAPTEIQSLINDVSDLQAVISEVTTALQVRVKPEELPPDSLRALQGLLDKATAKLLQLDNVIHKCLGPVGTRGTISPLGRLKWPRERPVVRQLQNELREIKLGIATLWGAANS
jgi:hypothetical protein